MVPWGLKWPLCCDNVIEEISFFDTVYWIWWQSFKRRNVAIWQVCMHQRFVRNRKWKEGLNEKSTTILSYRWTLYPFRGSIRIKQYNLSKPAKYGLLYRSLCDAVVPYTYYTLSYAGKPSETSNEASKYYIAGTDEYTKYLVNGVNHYHSIDGSNLSMDRYFTSVTIARWALENKITIVGTMRLDSKGIPTEIKSLENREERSVLHVFDNDENVCIVNW